MRCGAAGNIGKGPALAAVWQYGMAACYPPSAATTPTHTQAQTQTHTPYPIARVNGADSLDMEAPQTLEQSSGENTHTHTTK